MACIKVSISAYIIRLINYPNFAPLNKMGNLRFNRPTVMPLTAANHGSFLTGFQSLLTVTFSVPFVT